MRKLFSNEGRKFISEPYTHKFHTDIWYCILANISLSNGSQVNLTGSKFKGQTNLDSALKEFYRSAAHIQCHRDRGKRATGHLLPFPHQLL